LDMVMHKTQTMIRLEQLAPLLALIPPAQQVQQISTRAEVQEEPNNKMNNSNKI